MFVENLKTIAIKVLMLYIIAGIGFAADKFGVFTRDDAKRVIKDVYKRQACLRAEFAIRHSRCALAFASHGTARAYAYAFD